MFKISGFHMSQLQEILICQPCASLENVFKQIVIIIPYFERGVSFESDELRDFEDRLSGMEIQKTKHKY